MDAVLKSVKQKKRSSMLEITLSPIEKIKKPMLELIDKLKKNKIVLDRKILADLAQNNPDTFKKVLASLK
jgi:ribosomal protein L20